KLDNRDLGPESKNMFLDMVEKIGKELNAKNCWVCGSTGMSESWPWEGTTLNVPEVLKLTRGWSVSTWQRSPEESWRLRDIPVGEECIWRKG
ncbi:ENR1 protein, partial [Drymodes brunneopygia]|nr:ENR1 protein [Drymodes brunneopygia]